MMTKLKFYIRFFFFFLNQLKAQQQLAGDKPFSNYNMRK